MIAQSFFDEYEGLMHFVQWLRQQAGFYNSLRFDVTVYSKYEPSTDGVTTENFFGDTLVNELEEAVWALCKIKAAAALRRDLLGDPDDE